MRGRDAPGDPRCCVFSGTHAERRQVLHAAGASCEQHGERDGRRPAVRARLLRDRHTHDAPHAIDERSAARGDGKHRRSCPPRLEIRERLRVRHGIAAHRDRHIVAAVFTFEPDLFREPPHRRVIEEQRFRNRLKHVHRIIVAADVRQLVGENRLDLRRGQRSDGGDGQENHRPQPSDDGWHVDERRFDDVRRDDIETLGKTPACELPARRRRRQRDALQAPHAPPAAEHAAKEHKDAKQPRERDSAHEAIKLRRVERLHGKRLS